MARWQLLAHKVIVVVVALLEYTATINGTGITTMATTSSTTTTPVLARHTSTRESRCKAAVAATIVVV
jgi:hypothetical protein